VKIYDGALAQLENAGGARKKIITFQPALGSVAETTLSGVERVAGSSISFPETWKSAYGTTTRADDGKFTLCVPGENVVAVSQEILSTGPVADITIEDVPLEDVIAELFTSQK
jgi:ABC-2 type transport system ATP-binding protein